MLKIICQSLVLLNVVATFIWCVHMDFNGSKAKPPKGFTGFVGSLVANLIVGIIYYYAGAFDSIWK